MINLAFLENSIIYAYDIASYTIYDDYIVYDFKTTCKYYRLTINQLILILKNYDKNIKVIRASHVFFTKNKYLVCTNFKLLIHLDIFIN